MFKLETLNGEPLEGLYYLRNLISLGSLTHQKKLKKVLGQRKSKDNKPQVEVEVKGKRKWIVSQCAYRNEVS